MQVVILYYIYIYKYLYLFIYLLLIWLLSIILYYEWVATLDRWGPQRSVFFFFLLLPLTGVVQLFHTWRRSSLCNYNFYSRVPFFNLYLFSQVPSTLFSNCGPNQILSFYICISIQSDKVLYGDDVKIKRVKILVLELAFY